MEAGKKRRVVSPSCRSSRFNEINYTCSLPFTKKRDVKCTHSSSRATAFHIWELLHVHKAFQDFSIRSANTQISLSVTLHLSSFVSRLCLVLVVYIASLIISSSLFWLRRQICIVFCSLWLGFLGGLRVCIWGFFCFIRKSRWCSVHFLGAFSRRLTQSFVSHQKTHCPASYFSENGVCFECPPPSS